jgi:hypothetical protein
MLRRAATTALLVAMSACRFPSPIAKPTQPAPGEEYCQMAAAILQGTVKSHSELPSGLERACVEGRAKVGSAIYVDARFSRKVDPDVVDRSECVAGPYRIRFNWKRFVPAPSPEVVLLLVYDADSGSGTEFNVRMERPTWPENRPGVMALSQCGSVFGRLDRVGEQWTANPAPQ